MEMSRQQDLWSNKNGRGCDSARSASFNAHYGTSLIAKDAPDRYRCVGRVIGSAKSETSGKPGGFAWFGVDGAPRVLETTWEHRTS